MKKLTNFLIVLVSIFCLTLFLVGGKTVNAEETEENELKIGTYSTDSDFSSHWHGASHFGSKRIDDTTHSIITLTAWGARGVFETKYDLSSFTATLDLKEVTGNNTIALAFSNSLLDPNPYPHDDASGLMMDIIKKATGEHSYLVTLSNSSHNVSETGFTGGDASFLSDYSGIGITAQDDKITISFEADGDNIKITVNTVTVTLPKATVFSKLTDSTAVTVILGSFNSNSAEELINFDITVSDEATRTYYSATGAYGKAKAALDAYTESLKADLTVLENVQTATAKRDAIDLSTIRSCDLPRLQPTKTANDETLANALLAFSVPETITKEVSYRLDKQNDINVSVDLKDKTITEIKVNDTVLGTENYSYSEGVLTIKGGSLSTLAKGNYDITITTEGGSCTSKVVVYDGTEFAPVITEESTEHELRTSSDVEVVIDTKDANITKVEVNDTVLTSSNYKYNNGKLTIYNSFIETLTAGTYNVKVTTEDGEDSFELVIKSAVLPADRVPVMGVIGDDLNFYSHFQATSFGAVRTGITSMKVVLRSEYGYRAGYKNTFDVRNFEGSLNLSEISNGAIIIVLLGSNNQTYFSEGAGHVYLEIVKMTDNNFFIAFGNPTLSNNQHAASYPEFVDGTNSDKPGFTGITVTSDTSEVNFAMVQNEDNTVTITVNGATYTVAGAFDVLADVQNTYVSICGMTDTMTIQKLTVNYLYDSKLKEYYSETGLFGVANAKLAELIEAVKSLNTPEEVLNAVEIRDSINVKGLNSYDYNFIKYDYESAVAVLERAIAENPGILLTVVENAVQSAVDAVDTMKSLEDDSDVVALIKAAQTRINSLKDNNDIDQTRLVELETELNNAKDKRASFVKEKISAQFTAYIDSIDNIVDVTTMKETINLRNAISLTYEDLFEEEEWNTLISNKATADMKLAEKINYSGTNWEIKNGATNILEKDGTFHVINMNSVTVYTKEKLSVNDFDLKLENIILSNNTSSWLSIGIMEKPELFKSIEDETVQENKGIVFLITYADKTHVNIQMYIIDLMSSGFLTSNVQETITVDITNGLSMHLGTKEVTTAGVTANYIDATFNGVSFQSLISPRKYDIALGNERTGYLNISTNGTSASSMTSYVIKSINDHKLTDETYAKEYVPTPPTSTDNMKEFTLGTSTTVSYNLNTYGLDITKVVVGTTTIDAKNYTYANNYLAFKNDFLKTLTKGTHNIEVHTADGKVVFTLVVNEAAQTKPASKGCKGAVLVGAIASLITIGASVAVLIRKREY